MEVSRKKIHTVALEEGKRIQQWEEMRRKKVFETGGGAGEASKKAPEVLYIQVDGTGVNNRDSSKEWMECKVGTSYSERVLVSKDRVWLMDKKSCLFYRGWSEVDSQYPGGLFSGSHRGAGPLAFRERIQKSAGQGQRVNGSIFEGIGPARKRKGIA
jgi:hypothetical protein